MRSLACSSAPWLRPPIPRICCGPLVQDTRVMAGLHPVVVITGATGAIGSATASLLARRGARLLLLGRPSDRLDTMVERLDRDNRVSSVEVDLSSLAAVRVAARQISRTGAHV